MDCFGTYFTHAQSCDNLRVPSASGHMLNFRVFVFSRFRVFAFSRFRVFVFGFRVFVFSCLVFAFSRFRVLPPASPGPSHTFRMHRDLWSPVIFTFKTDDLGVISFPRTPIYCILQIPFHHISLSTVGM